ARERAAPAAAAEGGLTTTPPFGERRSRDSGDRIPRRERGSMRECDRHATRVVTAIDAVMRRSARRRSARLTVSCPDFRCRSEKGLAAHRFSRVGWRARHTAPDNHVGALTYVGEPCENRLP